MRICVNIQKAPPLSSTLYTAIAQRLPPGQYSNNPFCQHVTNVAEMRRMEAIVDNSAVIEPYDDRWQNINNEFIQKYAMSRSGITVLPILSFHFIQAGDTFSMHNNPVSHTYIHRFRIILNQFPLPERSNLKKKNNNSFRICILIKYGFYLLIG